MSAPNIGYVGRIDPHCGTMQDAPQYAVSSSLDAVDERMIEREHGDGD